MAEILGLGMTHTPAMLHVDEDVVGTLRRLLAGSRIPERLKDPRNWPAPMRAEWGDDQGVSNGRDHRERCFAASRVIRQRLDAFKPDAVLIFGDDQYENFTEDCLPPFCVYITDPMESRPFAPGGGAFTRNVWNEGPDTVFRHAGHKAIGRELVNGLNEEGFPIPYAYRLKYARGLAHAFINTLLYLDVDRKGFPYPVVPFHVNCYGSEVVRMQGATNLSDDLVGEQDPPSPSPMACFDIGRAVGRVLARSSWRVALIASSSWSHAFLTPKNDCLYPDIVSDRARFAELRDNRFSAWRNLSLATIEAAGQQEFLNWVTVAGAMAELGKKVEIVDWVESYVVNSNKCFAVFS